MIFSIDKLRRGTNALGSAELLKWKIALETETRSIASGPNAIGNLLDMTIFVTVTRMALENYWQPKVFGASAHPMLASCRNAETNISQRRGQACGRVCGHPLVEIAECDRQEQEMDYRRSLLTGNRVPLAS